MTGYNVFWDVALKHIFILLLYDSDMPLTATEEVAEEEKRRLVPDSDPDEEKPKREVYKIRYISLFCGVLHTISPIRHSLLSATARDEQGLISARAHCARICRFCCIYFYISNH